MFTDDKMEQVYAETGKSSDALKVLLDTLMDPEGVPFVEIKRANNIWKLFASRHKELKPEGFANVMIYYFPEKAVALKKLLS